MDLAHHYASRAGRLHGRLLFEQQTLQMAITAIERGKPERAAVMLKLARERMERDIDQTDAERKLIEEGAGKDFERSLASIRGAA
jgi:hypothetical protein